MPLGSGGHKRDKILKFEGGYHGLHDTALVSVKPKAEEVGDASAPNSVPGGLGIPQGTLDNVVIASFNDSGVPITDSSSIRIRSPRSFLSQS